MRSTSTPYGRQLARTGCAERLRFLDPAVEQKTGANTALAADSALIRNAGQ